MTVVLLALDALDAGLVEYFDANEFELETSQQIGTFAHSQNTPYTPEVWTTVATGIRPEKHGITRSGTSDWSNPILGFASRFTGRLNESALGRLGRNVRAQTGEREQIGETEAETIFDRDGAVVHNWQGVHDGSKLQHAWNVMNAVAEGWPNHEFERELFGLDDQNFGWTREILNHHLFLVGVHVHTLGAAGHAYAEDEGDLLRTYECVCRFVDEIVKALGRDDDLLILSDHEMRTSFYPGDDEDGAPAAHSWIADGSSTTESVPADDFDVVDWIDEHISYHEVNGERIDIDVEKLKKLGYR